jgi:hypothetical protein
MEKSIMFERNKTTRQLASGVQEFPFCPQRPDQAMSEAHMRFLLDEDDEEEKEQEEEEEEEADVLDIEEKQDEEGDGNGDNDSSESGSEGGGDFNDVLRNSLGLHLSNAFAGDGNSTIATNDNTSFTRVGLTPLHSNIDEDIAAATFPVPISPRSRYLVGCLRDNVNPRASLITRKHVSHELNMQHLGELMS